MLLLENFAEDAVERNFHMITGRRLPITLSQGTFRAPSFRRYPSRLIPDVRLRRRQPF